MRYLEDHSGHRIYKRIIVTFLLHRDNNITAENDMTLSKWKTPKQNGSHLQFDASFPMFALRACEPFFFERAPLLQRRGGGLERADVKYGVFTLSQFCVIFGLWSRAGLTAASAAAKERSVLSVHP